MFDDEEESKTTVDEILTQAAVFVAGLCFLAVLFVAFRWGWFG